MYHEAAPRGFRAMAVFLFFGATMAILAGFTLVFRGTPVDNMWRLNPKAFQQLALLGRGIGIAFLVLSCALLCSAIGWLRRRYWGWLLATIIIVIQVIGDLVNAIRGEISQGIFGVAIAGLLLLWLLQPHVRGAFR